MSLAPGIRVGSYEVVSRLGAGGMGEVYRARDARLGRDVALKALPEAFARDADRRARLEREARLLASLSHPNVASLFGIEDSNGAPVLVMELVPGPTLAERLLQRPLTVPEALDVARQVAEGLEAAHRKGIIHRDLKPANVKLTAEGRVKVLDFGLAKALSAALVNDPQQEETASRGETGSGVVLGTAAYMSPEQARGQELDERTDVWSFGCLLYECLTGRRAFAGATASDTVAAVLEHAPNWAVLPAATPALVRTLLLLCLQKERARRLQSVTDARLQIEVALSASVEDTTAGVAAARPRRWRVLSIAVAGVVGAALAAGLTTWRHESRPGREVIRLVAELPPGTHLAGASGLERLHGHRPSRTEFALSPDGTLLAFAAGKSGERSRLYLRGLGRSEATAMPATEGAASPFFSPDGRWIGYWVKEGEWPSGALYKVAVAGGLPVKLCDTTIPFGASWGTNGSIVFARELDGLWEVSAQGGTPRHLVKPDGKVSEILRSPHLLPDARAVVFTVLPSAWSWAQGQIVVLDLETHERRVLVEAGADARYVASGHLVYGAAGVLMAAPFDLERRRVTRPPVPVLDDVMQAMRSQNTLLETGALQLQVSASGTLVYAPGGLNPRPERSLLWLDRSGAAEPLDNPAADYEFPRVSPDGRRIVFHMSQPHDAIWSYDLGRRTLSRLTFQQGLTSFPLWSPDGRKIAFGLEGGGAGPGVFATEADGSGGLRPLVTALGVFAPSSWSPDGHSLAVVGWRADTANDVWIVSVDGQSAPRPVLDTRFDETYPTLSPDGAWLAYASNESGRYEVYVRSFPAPGPKHQISSSGGNAPVWASGGRELIYLERQDGGVRGFMLVDVSTSPTFSASTPRMLFRRRIASTEQARNYDVTPDGRRFLVITPYDAPDQRVTRLAVVLNWLEELKRIVPPR